MRSCEQITYFQGENIFILKLTNILRFTAGPCLENMFNQIKKIPHDHDIIIDMRDTAYIDSTILGIIAKFMLEKKPIFVCHNEDVKNIFSKIGVKTSEFFKDVDDRIELGLQDYVTAEIPLEDVKALKAQVLHSHQTLSDLQPGNADFKQVIDALKDK